MFFRIVTGVFAPGTPNDHCEKCMLLITFPANHAGGEHGPPVAVNSGGSGGDLLNLRAQRRCPGTECAGAEKIPDDYFRAVGSGENCLRQARRRQRHSLSSRQFRHGRLGHFVLVDAPEKADIVLEVSAPDTDRGVSVSSSSKPSTSTGRIEESTTTSRQLSDAPVRMLVYDARSKMPLWSASEQPKFAFKQKAREDNLVDAAQHLMTKFRERIETQMSK
jgi:hypothetical protein